MTLPADNTQWPPAADSNRYRRMRSWSAWYSGDPAALKAVYGGTTTTGSSIPTTINPRPGLAQRLVAAVSGSWWGEGRTGETDTRRHLPIAQDIATVSSELLFSERPNLTLVGEGTVDAEGKVTPAAKAVLSEVVRTLDRCGWHATLLAAAEISAALGSTGLRIALDPSGPLRDQPILVRQDADSTVPGYSWGILNGVTFWSVVRNDESTVWRYLEDHQAPYVTHALYKGSADKIGTRQPLDALGVAMPWALLPVDDQGRIRMLPENAPGATAVSIPNVLPDAMDRQNAAGRSDFTPAVIDAMDAADKAFSQMMDEVDDARSRLFLASSLLSDQGPGNGLGWDSSQRLYNKVKYAAGEDQSGLPIEQVQFQMRVEQYLTLIDALVAKAIRSAGYNAQTMGDEAGGDMTATEFVGRNRRSMSTRDKKGRYWMAPLGDLLTGFMQMHWDRFVSAEASLAGLRQYASQVRGWRIQVALPEAVQPTTLELANTAEALDRARAASTETRVRLVNPDWDETKVQREVEQIQSPDPLTLGRAGEGDAGATGI